MTALIQISDPHFGTERPAVVEALVRLVVDEAPELVVLSGDITQRATRRQFAAARAFADRLRTPALLAIAGNHDIPLFDPFARLFTPYGRYRAAFGHDLEPEHRSASWCVIGVKTTRRWRHEDGTVSAAQIERVAQRLGEAGPLQMRVVVVHQPVAVPDAADEANLLHGHRAAVRRWAEAGADLIVGGHIHLPYVLPLHEAQPGLVRRVWCVQAGTAVSTRVRHEAGNSVNVLRNASASSARDDRRACGDDRRACVERWDFDEADRCFVRVDTRILDLSDTTRDA